MAAQLHKATENLFTTATCQGVVCTPKYNTNNQEYVKEEVRLPLNVQKHFPHKVGVLKENEKESNFFIGSSSMCHTGKWLTWRRRGAAARNLPVKGRGSQDTARNKKHFPKDMG